MRRMHAKACASSASTKHLSPFSSRFLRPFNQIIERREAAERAEAERKRDLALEDAKKRSEELVFDFSFSWD